MKINENWRTTGQLELYRRDVLKSEHKSFQDIQ